MENSKQMTRFNLYGLIFIVIIMIPNIIFAAKCRTALKTNTKTSSSKRLSK